VAQIDLGIDTRREFEKGQIVSIPRERLRALGYAE
jgi:hypothetical protein